MARGYLPCGRRQLRRLAPRTTLGIADSAYNAGELDELGFRRTGVVPILFDRTDLHVEIDEAARERLAVERPDGSSTWLFVGQVGPDTRRSTTSSRRSRSTAATTTPTARLRIVGRSMSPTYAKALVGYVEELGLSRAVDITGSVSDAELGAHYATADVYVCLSEHEGFCVPLLEAMHHGLPVVAYRAGAITETMGSGGLGLESKDPLTVSTAVARVMSDPGVARWRLVRAGHERLEFFDLARSEATLREAIASVVGAA